MVFSIATNSCLATVVTSVKCCETVITFVERFEMATFAEKEDVVLDQCRGCLEWCGVVRSGVE